MATGKLFFDDEFDALAQMIANSERTHKELAAYLFPDMKPESAYAKLKACVNSNGDERLKFGQIIAAMNFCESFEPLQYACDQTLHARPPRITPSDEERRQVEVIEATTRALNRALETLDRMRERPAGKVRAV